MRRKVFHRIFCLMTGLCALAGCGVLALVVWAIVRRGLPAVSWEFYTEQIRLVGTDGGIFYNIIGTGILLLTALAVSAPVSISLALLQGVYLEHSRWQRPLTLMLYLLNGVPSILFGILGLIVFVNFLGWGKSWLSGGILLGFMILPTISLTLAERIAGLPRKYAEAAAGLGLRRSQIIRSVILPQCFGGWVTGSLLGLARAAGETAPIMFTATIFAGAALPQGIRESPVLTLPYHIFILAQDSFDPATGEKLWGAALTLLMIVLLLSFIALPARLKIHEEARHG